VGLEWGPLSLVSTVEELLGRNSSGSGLETENTAVGIRDADHVAPSSKFSFNKFKALHTFKPRPLIWLQYSESVVRLPSKVPSSELKLTVWW
jgi:hypothetical protein